MHTLILSLSHSDSSAHATQGQNDKLELLEQTILPHTSGKSMHGLVFCNTLDSCRAVEHYLQNNTYDAYCLHGSVPVGVRKDVISNYLSSDSGVLITTDLAARGLDFGGKVQYVVNFDFPHNKVDYLHRTGRTARAGKKGLVYSLVRGRDRRLAKEIEVAVTRRETIKEKPLNRGERVPPSEERGGRRPTRRPTTARQQGRAGGRGGGPYYGGGGGGGGGGGRRGRRQR